MNKLINGNAIYQMATFDEASVDLIITDPPFGIDQDKTNHSYNRDHGFVIDGYVEIPNAEYDEFCDQWIEEAARVLIPSGSMYIISGWTNLEDVLRALRQHRLHVINHIIWKYSFGVFTKNKFVTSHYHILYVRKNKDQFYFNRNAYFDDAEIDTDGTKLCYADREDVWYIGRENWPGTLKTKNKLPRNLVEKMIRYSSVEGDVILDPFMGSGQVPFIAHELNRQYIGIEISTPVYDFSRYRIITGDYFGTNYKVK